MRLELIEMLDREARGWNEARREREAGYPKLRRRIREFIRSLPRRHRSRMRGILLPTKLAEKK